MEEAQQQPSAPGAQEQHEPAASISRGKTIALWAGVAALLLALLGSLMIVLKSLQADRALAQIGKSAGSAVTQDRPPAVTPPAAAGVAEGPLRPPPLRSAGEQPGVAAVAPPAPPKHGPGTARPHRSVPPATAQRSTQKAPEKQALAARPARKAAPRAQRFSVERGLAQCKELAGEAAAACFRKACSTYAKRAPICVNDEPTARR
ncbi:hypothetical protein [Massilia endophytica]|uniref:hypothetical protein n=1 Tax=Massilia endophytica TaxID=2899220 RepID=UPI001E4E9F00|nr:hypothetical protein [Massilia endophytica]UGQ48487.1 hypothetical protein LSQ66_08480 [Massilia endophytica]